MLRLLLVIPLVLLSWLRTPAQEPLAIEDFTIREGLSENVVHTLYQDKKGFLWIGTHEGLNRYDGYGFKKYSYDKNDPGSIPNQPIQGITEDHSGNLVIRTIGGLYAMSPAGKFYYLDDFRQSYDRYQDAIFSFAKQLWHPFEADLNWFFYFQAVPERGLPLCTSQLETLRSKKWLEAIFDGSRRLWLMDRDSVWVLDNKGERQTVLRGLRSLKISTLDANLLMQDPTGHIWIRTDEKLFGIDAATLKLKTTVLHSQVPGFPFSNINVILLDRNNVLWLGSFYGLKKVNLNDKPVKHFSREGSGRGLASEFILGLKLNPDGKLTAQHHFLDSVYSEVDLDARTITHKRIDSVSLRSFLADVLVRNPERVKNWDRQIKRIENKEIGRRTARYFYADREGVIWWVYSGSVLGNLADGRQLDIRSSVETLWDDAQFLWIATTHNGLHRYNKVSGEHRVYRYTHSDPHAISSNELLCMTADSAGNLWLGTRAGGLNFYNRGEDRFYQYSMADGLANGTIYSMVLDDSGNLWIGTANGLSCFEIQSGKFHNYYTSDGFSNNEYNRWSAVKDDEGNLYFGGMNGIDYFDPRAVLSNRPAPAGIMITDIKAGDQLQPPGDRAVLGHSDNFLSFEFSTMDFRNPAAARYAYMLEGSGSDSWIFTENNRTAVFAALPPGHYKFRVKGANQPGNWGEEAAYSFQILPPWWQQNWFYLLCVLTLVTAAYIFYRFRVDQLKKLIAVRARISRDLHDDVGASLSSIHIYSTVAEKTLDEDRDKTRSVLRKIHRSSREVMENMNDIVWALESDSRRELSLDARIRNYGYDLLSGRNIHCTYDIDPAVLKKLQRPEDRRNILLLIKEAMNNIAKYSAATHAEIKVGIKGSVMLIRVKDDGKGFGPGASENGNGQVNMRKRAVELGGELTVNSEPGGGTIVECTIPLTNISDWVRRKNR